MHRCACCLLRYICAAWLPAAALENGLGRRPLMGWSSWNAYAASPALNETTILAVMDALIDRRGGGVSLADRGYRYVNLDDGIVLKERNADGTLAVDTGRFPSGLAALAAEAHMRSLKFGVYTARGTCLDALPRQVWVWTPALM